MTMGAIVSETSKVLTSTGFAASLVSGLIIAVASPALNSILGTKKGAAIGVGLGLTICIWVIVFAVIRAVDRPSRQLSNGTTVVSTNTAAAAADPVGRIPKATDSGAIPQQQTPASPTSEPRRKRRASEKSTPQTPPVQITGPVHGPVIISQNQSGGQVAATINNFAPPQRALSAHQRAQIAEILRPYAGQCVAFASTSGNLEAHQFKVSLINVFREAGWVVRDMQTFMFFGEHTGFVVSIPQSTPEDGLPQVIAKALAVTGNPVSGNRGDFAPDCVAYVQVWHAPPPPPN